MDYGKFRCRHCSKLRRRQTREQRYCDLSECQKARKNGWRRARYAADADYRANQRDSTNAWLKGRGGAAAYHREYRQRGQRTGAEQAKAAQLEPGASSANSDATPGELSLKSGVYVLTPIATQRDTNSDAIFARIDLIPAGWGQIANIDPVVGPPSDA